MRIGERLHGPLVLFLLLLLPACDKPTTPTRTEPDPSSPATGPCSRPESTGFRGRSVEGDHLASNAILSHDFPPPPTFSPNGGEVVDPRRTVVEWNAPGAEQVELIMEQEELGHVLDVTLSGSSRRLRVPPQFLTPGKKYKIEILSVSEYGNRTIAENPFRTRS
jgi:hypothetical protein